jgi:hypothetical protein
MGKKERKGREKNEKGGKGKMKEREREKNEKEKEKGKFTKKSLSFNGKMIKLPMKKNGKK